MRRRLVTRPGCGGRVAGWLGWPGLLAEGAMRDDIPSSGIGMKERRVTVAPEENEEDNNRVRVVCKSYAKCPRTGARQRFEISVIPIVTLVDSWSFGASSQLDNFVLGCLHERHGNEFS